MAKQIERYERALKLLESTYNMVSSEFPPPEDASSTKPPDEKQDEDEE
jgi:archaellum component FlaC